MKRRTYDGIWWLPADPTSTIGGRLETFPVQSAVIELNGSFKDVDELVRSDVATYDPVFGATREGKEVTLSPALESGVYFSSTGFMRQDLVVPVVFVGAHLPTPRATPIDKAFAEFSTLPEWTGWRIDSSIGSERPQLSIPDFPDITASVAGATLSLSHGWGVAGDSVRRRTLSLTPHLVIEPIPALTMEEIDRRWLRPFEFFLSLVTRTPTHLTSLTAHFEGADERERVEVLTPRRGSDAELRPPKPFEMTLGLDQLGDGFPLALESWLSSFEALTDVYNLYFSSYGSQVYEEAKFLTLSLALEVFDRRREDNFVLPKPEHKQRVRQVLNALTDPLKSWVSEILAYSNEPRLRTRATRLVDRSRPATTEVIPDRDTFAKLVADTRNYYTHYDPALATKAARGVELAWLNERLRFLLEVLILGELGIEPAAADAMFKRPGVKRTWNQRHVT
ncbi:hypothetical protein BH23CHL7_BH23CHL7_05690 [soil metagenome]